MARRRRGVRVRFRGRVRGSKRRRTGSRRRFTSRKRRFYKKRMNRRLLSMGRPVSELKYLKNIVTVPTDVTTAGTGVDFFANIVQGVGHQDRLGDKIWCENIRMWFMVRMDETALGDNHDTLRCHVLRWPYTRSDASDVVIGNELDPELFGGDTFFIPFRTFKNRGQIAPFKVHYLKRKTVIRRPLDGSTATSYHPYCIFAKNIIVRRYIQWGQNDTVRRRNEMSMYMYSNSNATPHPTFTGWWIVYWRDA